MKNMSVYKVRVYLENPDPSYKIKHMFLCPQLQKSLRGHIASGLSVHASIGPSVCHAARISEFHI